MRIKKNIATSDNGFIFNPATGDSFSANRLASVIISAMKNGDDAELIKHNILELNVRLGWLQYLNKNYTASQGYYQKSVKLRPMAIEARFGYVKPLSYLQSGDKVLEQYLDALSLDGLNRAK